VVVVRKQSFDDVLVLGPASVGGHHVHEDSQFALALDEAITEAVNQAETRIVVDLSAVPWISDALAATLARGLERAGKSGGRLKLLNPNERLLAFFEVTKLDQVLEIHMSKEDALKSFEQNG